MRLKIIKQVIHLIQKNLNDFLVKKTELLKQQDLIKLIINKMEIDIKREREFVVNNHKYYDIYEMFITNIAARKQVLQLQLHNIISEINHLEQRIIKLYQEEYKYNQILEKHKINIQKSEYLLQIKEQDEFNIIQRFYNKSIDIDEQVSK